MLYSPLSFSTSSQHYKLKYINNNKKSTTHHFWDISTFLYFKDIQFRHILKCTGTWFNATCQYSPIHESATSQWIKCTYLLFVQVIKYLERALLLLLFNLGNDSSESDGSTHPWQTGLLHSTCILKGTFTWTQCVCLCVSVREGGATVLDMHGACKRIKGGRWILADAVVWKSTSKKWILVGKKIEQV